MDRDISELGIQYIKGVGPARAALFARLGVHNVRDALWYFPARYEDRRTIKKLGDLVLGSPQTVVGEIVGVDVKDIGSGRGGRLFRRGQTRPLSILEITISDDGGSLKAKWFNQPFLKKKFAKGEKIVLYGTVKDAGWGAEMHNPEYELIGEDDAAALHTGRIVPVYGATENLSSRQIRGIIYSVLGKHLDGLLEDHMPQGILERMGLPALKESIANVHFPSADLHPEELNRWRTPFQRRVVFDELFMLELGLAIMKRGKERERGISFRPDGRFREKLLASLPFRLTPAQELAWGEILRDMQSPHPMNRLLQGDVGSGKTIVALMAMLAAAECGWQSALMAPTEILAEQHFMNIRGPLEALGLNAALLTGSAKERPLEGIASGAVHIVVGTHALIQEGVEFNKLGLVVIDEQHRFGVLQRAALRGKAHNPDVLIMTATPIPRTLALTLYGDLDCSVIGELPPGRTPVQTRIFGPEQKDAIYAEIGREVKGGGQVYVVYPVIEESEQANLKSAIEGAEGLRKKFPAMRVALVHGRMKPAEREAAVASFKDGKVDILVSTTVIEVGVDVPNASLMLVVHAERFGLSQLHQLRGRVGRGVRPSRCLLLAYGPMGEEARRRLDVMAETTDGFRMAEEDLAIRGPGEFMGTRQSGLPDLRVADLVRDAALIEPARREAFALIAEDPELKGCLLLRRRLEGFWRGKVELFHTG